VARIKGNRTVANSSKTAKARMVRHDTKNLVKRGNVWWFRKVIRGDLHWFALDTSSLPEARTRRDRYLADLADGRQARSSKKTFDESLGAVCVGSHADAETVIATAL
jgi:hypothetical protein